MFSRRSRDSRHPRVRHVGELAAPSGYDALVTVGVGPGGPVAIWAAPQTHRRLTARSENEGGASFPTTHPDVASTVAIAAYGDEALAPSDVVELEGLPVSFPLIQSLPDRSYLVVGARCQLGADGPEKNALIIGRDGMAASSGCLGDGIAHLQTDDAGTIWAGYYDEGIYGNLGWGEPGGPAPLGSPGLVRWSTAFEKLWEYPQVGTIIDDCYALNVTGDEVWACTYSDNFPIIRVHEGRSRVLSTTGLSGPRGVVVQRSRFGVLGRYDDPGAFVVGDLVDDRFVEASRGYVWLPDGSPLPAAAVHCRGPRAHFFVDTDWFSIDLSELTA